MGVQGQGRSLGMNRCTKDPLNAPTILTIDSVDDRNVCFRRPRRQSRVFARRAKLNTPGMEGYDTVDWWIMSLRKHTNI